MMNCRAFDQIQSQLENFEESEARQRRAIEEIDRSYRLALRAIEERRSEEERRIAADRATKRAIRSNELTRLRRDYEARVRAVEKQMREERRRLLQIRENLETIIRKIPTDIEEGHAEPIAVGTWYEFDELYKLLEIVQTPGRGGGLLRLFGGVAQERKDALARLRKLIDADEKIIDTEISRLPEKFETRPIKEEYEKLKAKVTLVEEGEKAPFDAVFAEEKRRLESAYRIQRERALKEQKHDDGALNRCLSIASSAMQECGITGARWKSPFTFGDKYPVELPVFIRCAQVFDVELRLPATFELARLGSIWFEGIAPDEVYSGVRAIVTYWLRMMPLGSLRVFWFDAGTRGRSLGYLAPLAAMEGTREAEHAAVVVATNNHAMQELSERLENHMGNVGIRAAGANGLFEYNQDRIADSDNVGESNTPFIMVVVADILDCSQSDIRSTLYGAVRNASELGIQTLICAKQDYEHDSILDAIKKLSNEINTKGDYLVQKGDEAHLEWLRIPNQVQSFVREAKEAREQQNAGARLAAMQHGSSGVGINIPVGCLESGDEVCLNFGSQCVHAVISGTTGSGKTSLLNNMIINSSIKYSVDELNIWLVDYKTSEFAQYRNEELRPPHVTFLGLESSRDFVQGFMQLLEDEFRSRQKLCREHNVRTIDEYNRQRGVKQIPRLLIIIDEFHRQSSLMVDLYGIGVAPFDFLLRECRSYGMHLVISDQTPASLTGLPPSARQQMSGRILMKWSEASEVEAMMEDRSCLERPLNTFEAYLKTGQGSLLFHTRYPSREWIKSQVRIIRSKEHGEMPSFLSYVGKERHVLNDDVVQGDRALPIGERPNFRNPVFSIELLRRRRENLFILGSDYELACSIAALAMRGAARRLGYACVLVGDDRDPLFEASADIWDRVDQDDSCKRIESLEALCSFVLEGDHEKEFIVWISPDAWLEEMEDYPVPVPRETGAARAANSLDEQLAVLAASFGIEASERDVSPIDGSRLSSGSGGIYDIRASLYDMLVRGGLSQVHICWVSETIPNVYALFSPGKGATYDVETLFAHRFAPKCSASSSVALGMQYEAAELDGEDDQGNKTKVIYSNREQQIVQVKPYVFPRKSGI